MTKSFPTSDLRPYSYLLKLGTRWRETAQHISWSQVPPTPNPFRFPIISGLTYSDPLVISLIEFFERELNIHPEHDFASIQACEFAVDLDKLHSALKDHIREAQSRYQVSADRTCSPHPKFPIGSSAFVKAQFFHTTWPAKKFAEKYLGPFEIIGRAGTHSVILCLPDSMRAVHPVFHVSMLEPSLPNTIPNRIQPPPALIVIDGEPKYEISEILDTKIDRRQWPCNLLYLVRWSSYEGTDDKTSWVLATELSNASKIITEFHSRYPSKPGLWPSWQVPFQTLGQASAWHIMLYFLVSVLVLVQAS